MIRKCPKMINNEAFWGKVVSPPVPNGTFGRVVRTTETGKSLKNEQNGHKVTKNDREVVKNG